MQRTITKPTESFRDLWTVIGLAAVAVGLAGLTVWLVYWSMSPANKPATPHDPMANISQTAFTETTGVRLVRVTTTAGGGMLDLRYQVVDPDKAGIVHDSDNPPTIVDEVTGQSASRPWMHHSSGRTLQAAVTYNELLLNPGGVVKSGSLITVVIGNSRLEHVVVQ